MLISINISDYVGLLIFPRRTELFTTHYRIRLLSGEHVCCSLRRVKYEGVLGKLYHGTWRASPPTLSLVLTEYPAVDIAFSPLYVHITVSHPIWAHTVSRFFFHQNKGRGNNIITRSGNNIGGSRCSTMFKITRF